MKVFICIKIVHKKYQVLNNGPFLTVNQSMFTKVEVTNQWHYRAHDNLCPTLHKEHAIFVCEQACELLTQ